MQKIYLLEGYSFDHDYWTTIGAYLTKEEALKKKKEVEARSNLYCSIFERNLITLFSMT